MKKISNISKKKTILVIMVVFILIIATFAYVFISTDESPRKEPHVLLELNYATGEDRTLIRWVWNTTEYPNPDFRLYREGAGGVKVLLSKVEPITDESIAEDILDNTDPRWPTLHKDLLTGTFNLSSYGVTDISSLIKFLRSKEGGLHTWQLLNMRYPLALVMGRGYLDTDFKRGAQYTYELVAKLGDFKYRRSVQLTAGELTPLSKPTNLIALDLGPGSEYVQPRDGDWNKASLNRRLDRNIYLSWDYEGEGETFTEALITGYDVYRAEPGSAVYERLTSIHPAQPMPTYNPMNSTEMLNESLDYSEIQMPFYYVDKAPNVGSWEYRVAPRDLLDQIREWPSDESQFSNPVTAVAYDFIRPPMPEKVNATVPPSNDRVVLTWDFDFANTTDFLHFVIYRSLNVNAPIDFTQAASCDDQELCWKHIATVDVTEWIDTDSTKETIRWYLVHAIDQSGNRGALAAPVQAVIHDNQGPSIYFTFTNGNLITVQGLGGTVRMRLYCRFSPEPGGLELPIKEFEGSYVGDFDITDVYTPPIPLKDVACRFRAVDVHGNLGPFSETVEIDIYPTMLYVPPQPIIVSVTTMVGGVYGWTAAITWESLDAAGLAGFRIMREDVLAGTVNELVTLSPDSRNYDDSTVNPNNYYYYTVIAFLETQPPYNGRFAESLPWTYKVVTGGERPLRLMTWNSATFIPGTGTLLDWNDPDGICFFVVERITPQCYHAVFRSVYKDRDYIQISPIHWAHSEYGDPAQFPYWYVVVQFDPRTGEPVAYTPPIQATGSTPPTNIDWRKVLLVGEPAIPVSNCPGTVAPNLGLKGLHFGDGFDVVNISWTSTDPDNLAGDGLLELHPAGITEFIPVKFSGISVGDSQNHVCNGTLTKSMGSSPFLVDHYSSGLVYEIHFIEVRPWFDKPNTGIGWIVIRMPDVVRYDEVGVESSQMPVSDVDLHSDLSFDFTFDMGSLLGHSCDEPLIDFRHETLPTTIVPLGILTADEERITMSGSCMKYLERAEGLPRPDVPDAYNGDANDGFLRGVFAGAGKAYLLQDGTYGNYVTDIDMSWVASFPFEFNVLIYGPIELTLKASRIRNGTAGYGFLLLSYYDEITGGSIEGISATFSDLTIDEGGALRGLVKMSTPVSWGRGGFSHSPASLEMYLGMVTTLETPEKAMWQTRPGDSVDLSPEISPGYALLDPGLNRRKKGDSVHWENCDGDNPVDFDATMDTYLRHGGVSGRMKTNLTSPLDVSVCGYDTMIEAFDLFFLDNLIYDSDVRGELYLPFPADITLKLVDMQLNERGCIMGGQVPHDDREKLLSYWQIHSSITSVQWRDDAGLPPDPNSDWRRMLWIIGSLDLPHIGTIQIEASFEPDGDFNRMNLVYERPDLEFDGFPLLVEEIRLSRVPETSILPGGIVLPPPSLLGNIEDRPENNWKLRGYFEIQGLLITPYFGPIVGTEFDYPAIRALGWDDFVGFDTIPQVERFWMERPYEFTHFFDHLAYGFNEDIGRAVMVGIETFEFPPFQDGLPLSDFLDVDMSIVIESDLVGGINIEMFSGLSSGVAALRALSEATVENLVGELSDELYDTMCSEEWRERLGFFDRGFLDEYADLAKDIWSQYSDLDKLFSDTTEVLFEHGRQFMDTLPSYLGGAALGQLEDWGVKLEHMHGDVTTSGSGFDIQFESVFMSAEATIKVPGSSENLLHVDSISLEINRQGDFLLSATGITSRIFGQTFSADFNLRINLFNPGIAGGLTVYDLNFGTVRIRQAGALFGVGDDFYFIGIFIDDAEFEAGGYSISVEGGVLIGKINPADPILMMSPFGAFAYQVAGFDRAVNPTANGRYTGFFLTVGASWTVFDYGCAFKVRVGGEFSLWYWTKEGGGSNWGGRLKGYFTVAALCIVYGRGDLSLRYQMIDGESHFEGSVVFLIGFGCYSCDPHLWWRDFDDDGDYWEHRWWRDEWCWQAGAYGRIWYDGDEWHDSIDADCETFC